MSKYKESFEKFKEEVLKILEDAVFQLDNGGDESVLRCIIEAEEKIKTFELIEGSKNVWKKDS